MRCDVLCSTNLYYLKRCECIYMLIFSRLASDVTNVTNPKNVMFPDCLDGKEVCTILVTVSTIRFELSAPTGSEKNSTHLSDKIYFAQ